MDATQQSSEAQINQLNLQMRQQPWYQEWFQARGLDPNRVRLTEAQRRELTALAAQHGFTLGDRMKFDEAGNINQKGGFAGMPTWGKALIAAAPAAATAGLGLAGMGPLSFLGGGGGAASAAGAPAALEASIFASPAAKASAAAAMGGSAAAGAAGAAGSGAGRGVLSRLGEGVAESGTDRAISAALAALAGLPAMLGNKGPSDEERGYQAQATRLLGQQEQRTQFQNPLYEAVTKMAHGLLPTMGNGGNPYPIGSLNDVKVPGLEDLMRTAQRRS